MLQENFNKLVSRYSALKEYNKMFNHCVEGLKDPEISELACKTGKNLIAEHGFEIMENSGNRILRNLPLALNLDWIVDTAVLVGYDDLERGTMSTGIFSSCPCVSIGSFWAKQKFGIKLNKDDTVSLLYCYNTFAADNKLINTLLLDIFNQLIEKYKVH